MAAKPSRPASTRVSIARLAERVIAANAGVSATQGSGRWLTQDGDHVIQGVVAAEARGGRVDVEMHLVASWPPQPLDRQATQLRVSLIDVATRSGLRDRLGQIDVSIHDVGDPVETEEER